MSGWNPNTVLLVGSSAGSPDTAGAQATSQAGAPVTPDWQRWVAENLLLRVPPSAILDAMLRQGIDRTAAEGEIRAALTHPYLAAAQSLSAGAACGPNNKLKKRDWVLEVYRRSACQASSFGQVPHVHRLSRQAFLDDFYSQNRPVVIEGALDHWPALTRWTADNLKKRFGDRIVEVQFGRAATTDYEINSTRHKRAIPFADYVELVETAGPTNDYYMTANNSGKNKEALAEVWNDIIPLQDYLCDDPANRGFFWYGPQGTLTPLHHDLTNNFMAQVRGRKLVRLIAPHDLADVYNHRHCFSQVDLDRVDHAQFPQFRNVQVIDVTIGPGDLFFLPVAWWHYVRGLDVTITLTFTNFVFDNDFYSFYTTYEEI